jgi:hypothetical protein
MGTMIVAFQLEHRSFTDIGQIGMPRYLFEMVFYEILPTKCTSKRFSSKRPFYKLKNFPPEISFSGKTFLCALWSKCKFILLKSPTDFFYITSFEIPTKIRILLEQIMDYCQKNNTPI